MIFVSHSQIRGFDLDQLFKVQFTYLFFTKLIIIIRVRLYLYYYDDYY